MWECIYVVAYKVSMVSIISTTSEVIVTYIADV